ncbi:flagellar hook-associated protein FlgK [Parvularcula lutaonensis]|uniref:Flagellar hook-associated protein 1 n=1 Tax=Parvularcula lutaonensis TaxID=491923 RepID=A0ABV7M9M2_9PROT|nr:flagellar hook-associated protein FlgK [Parvularcula lutaonensis]GGY43808.1 flagellar hook protein FlgK [Parvularcula lutaonensis]
MTFSAIMTNSLSGLNAASLRAEVLSFNIANANTAGYARRSLSVAAAQPGGVRAVGIERAETGHLERQLLGAGTEQGGAEVRADALKQINAAFGEPGDPNGLYASFARFEQALADLRLTPESGSTQLAFLRAAQDVTGTFQQLDTEAQAMRLAADSAIATKVNRLNDALVELDNLNQQALRPRGVALETVAERQQALVSEIAAELDVNVNGTYGGRIELRTEGGLLLLGDEPQYLDFTAAGSASFELSYANGDFSGLTVGGYDITPGTLQGLKDGGLAAEFAVRDVIAQDYASRLDAAAAELAARSAIADGTSPDGLFVLSAGTSSAAQRLQVNAAADPAQGGQLFRVRDGMGAVIAGPSAGDGILGALKAELDNGRPLPAATGTSSALSYLETLGALGTELGTQALRAEGIREAARGARETFAREVGAQTGVDTDRELQELLLVEQAFAANARVIQTADEMLRQLLEI